jgi:hypothetical protein
VFLLSLLFRFTKLAERVLIALYLLQYIAAECCQVAGKYPVFVALVERNGLKVNVSGSYVFSVNYDIFEAGTAT